MPNDVLFPFEVLFDVLSSSGGRLTRRPHGPFAVSLYVSATGFIW